VIELINVKVGLHIDHDLKYATTKALEQVEEELVEDPSIILYFTGTHRGGKKTYNEAMAVIREKYPKIPMAGCSGVGIAGKNDYGLKGAGLMFICGVKAKSNLIKRFRIGTRYKTRKVVKECEKTNRIEKKRDSNNTNVFFPPGLGFPKFMVNLLNHRIEGFNPFFILNNQIWRKFPILSKISGIIVGLSMDLLGIGISYSSTWSLFRQLYNKGIHFTGTFGADPITMGKSYQFYNFKAYKDSLSYISISSPNLQFASRSDSGAEVIAEKSFDIDSFLNGGFIPRIRGKWGSQALLEMLDMDQTADILEENTRRYFYYQPHRPLCVIDENDKPNLYALSINPNLKHALITAPNQVVQKLKAKNLNRYKAFLSDQSVITIENLIDKTLSEFVTDDTAFGLFFDCGNRAMIVGDRFEKYNQRFVKYLSEIPYLLIISGGEVNFQDFPVVNFSTISSIARHRNTPVG
jgi:hypothetical protein